MEPRALKVEGYSREPQPCVFYGTRGEQAAVILPGNAAAAYRLGGTPARPDLHYTRAFLVESGFDVLEAW